MSGQAAFKKLASSLKEIRIHLCSRDANANATRQFIDQHYLKIKQDNPQLPILIRECTGVEPKMWLRFEFGREASLPLKGLSSSQIASLLKDKAGVA